MSVFSTENCVMRIGSCFDLRGRMSPVSIDLSISNYDIAYDQPISVVLGLVQGLPYSVGFMY